MIFFLQIAHRALVEELTYVSSRNCELEEFYTKHGTLMTELRESQKQREVLLTMLGEKSEEVEACMQDLQDVKELYRNQMDDLLQFKIMATGGTNISSDGDT